MPFRSTEKPMVLAAVSFAGGRLGIAVSGGVGLFLLIARREYRPVRDHTYYSLSMRWRRGTASKSRPPPAKPAFWRIRAPISQHPARQGYTASFPKKVEQETTGGSNEMDDLGHGRRGLS